MCVDVKTGGYWALYWISPLDSEFKWAVSPEGLEWRMALVLRPLSLFPLFSFLFSFNQVMESEEFMLLPANQLIDIISSDELNVRSEEQVFNAVMAWVKYSIQERRPQLPQVILSSETFKTDLSSGKVRRADTVVPQQRHCSERVQSHSSSLTSTLVRWLALSFRLSSKVQLLEPSIGALLNCFQVGLAKLDHSGILSRQTCLHCFECCIKKK